MTRGIMLSVMKNIKKFGFETKVTVPQGIDEMVRVSQAVVYKTPYSNV